MKSTIGLVAFALVVAAAPAAAQTPAPPQPQPPERKAAPRESGLNLKLDEADLRSLSRNTSVPRDESREQSADGLPSLGGDARRIEQAPPSSDTRRPYPSDTQMISR